MAIPKRILAVAALAVVAVSGCTTKKQETPSLTGPSDVATSLSIQASPDVLSQDGASQSLVTVTARDTNGQPIRNLPLRAEIAVAGIIADFGSLSARNVVTDGSGRATVVYTAPPSPAGQIGTTTIAVQFTASGTNFANDVPREASIRLVPPGVVTPGPSGVVPSFSVNPPAPTDHQVALFDATASKSANGPIVSYQWNFGDGDSGSGITTQHSYDDPGTYVVRLTITDTIGASNSVSQSVTVGQGTVPTATIIPSPSAPIVGQTVNFNGSTSRPAPGRTIVNYAWDFGDGSSGGGATATHAYSTAGTYTVILTVTDDAGRTATATQPINVASDAPQARFTFAPASPRVGNSVAFDANTSTAANGRTIVSYNWSFGDGATATGPTTTHAYAAVNSYTVVLTVTDSAGKTATTSQTITIIP